MSRARQTHSSNGIDRDKLQSLDARYTRMAEELETLQQDMKEILVEMKSAGYNTKMYKKAAKIRKIGYAEHREMEDELDLYLHALDIIEEAEHEPAY